MSPSDSMRAVTYFKFNIQGKYQPVGVRRYAAAKAGLETRRKAHATTFTSTLWSKCLQLLDHYVDFNYAQLASTALLHPVYLARALLSCSSIHCQLMRALNLDLRSRIMNDIKAAMKVSLLLGK